jgi:molybdate transport system substrate-binding protein
MSLILAACMLGCSQGKERASILVSSASSLTDALTQVGQDFQSANPDLTVQFNFASSGALQRQIEQGAPADIFISASPDEMEALIAKGLADRGSRFDLAGNTLVLIGPPASRATSWDDLGRAGRVTIANPATSPVGRYARSTLERRGLWQALRPKLVYAENARQTLAYVIRGDVDLAIVFETDLRLARGRAKLIAAAEEKRDHEPIRYPAALLARGNHHARRFLEYLRSPEATAVLKQHGFSDVR